MSWEAMDYSMIDKTEEEKENADATLRMPKMMNLIFWCGS